MILNPGDIFCVTGDSLVQSAIKGCNSVASVDGKADYGHAGIITSSAGSTFEAVERYSRHNIFQRYEGCEILIGRHVNMTLAAHEAGMKAISHLEGSMYPWFRLAVYLVPYLPKFVHFGKPVCSELVFMYLSAADMNDCDYFWGVSPDYVADAIHRWDVFEPVFEGRLKNVQ